MGKQVSVSNPPIFPKNRLEFNMNELRFEKRDIDVKGVRVSVTIDEVEVGRAYIYLMHNDLHDQPFALMEDVYVDETYRGKGIGSEIVRKVIESAREANCYKLIATSRVSRPKVHELYQRLGFTEKETVPLYTIYCRHYSPSKPKSK